MAEKGHWQSGRLRLSIRKAETKYPKHSLHLAKQYLEGVHFFTKRYQTVSRLLNPQDIHILAEPHVYTISLYAHALSVSDSTFEENHQPLKALIAKTYHKNNRITAVYQIITND